VTFKKIVLPSVVLLNVILPSVVAPFLRLLQVSTIHFHFFSPKNLSKKLKVRGIAFQLKEEDGRIVLPVALQQTV
jgi:hypothetical protein